ncbi:PaaI family thioesterase [Alkalihalophilus sp. As8PL]|uniref:PaaI family thioesterase n=1 Tax=Alkalihalophilus sp. As8PL TaxID=3237103 RepID=A0AB39BVR1_9BACI
MTHSLERVEQSITGSPFFKHMGFKITEFEEDRVVLTFEMQNHAININGNLHGGVQASMLDIVMGMAIRALTRKDCVTLNLNIHYLVAVSKGVLTATATIIQKGYKIVTVEADLKTEEGLVVSKGIGTFKVIHS